MIKANELRKGVLIIDYTGIVREVYGEDIQQQCWYEEGQTGTTEAPLNHIPITPEWLERCGFEMDTVEDNCYYATKWGAIMVQVNQYKELQFMLDGVDLPHIKYLHQLQNLYFALTGEELNVKL